ncbi:CubicO group peptidase, beta-lactamase class C family [Stigmatella aurantiaca]|uniref:CubicO group peptidase, beta-lactamase class C family n=1 Tax=Stigmatella aurantiaca TaxID=41 RepID=A0A1H7G5Q0_STIAU|nr:serine hydrolase domain-containing protein [Stigmatella aurantiaca]SEK31780.1 CubicO group peptidase, beta-lactamase class C family [Stigmatella aurantiaca]
MKLKQLVLVSALAASVAGNTACSDDPTPPAGPPACEEVASSLSLELTERIDRFIAGRMAQGHVTGLSLVVLREGKPAYVRGYGFTHVDGSQRMTACSRVSIGSTTKSMTVLALMQLVEQGKVDLDAPVTRYLPWFQTADGRGGDILVRHLLSHTAGLPRSSLLEGDMDDGALERHVREMAQVRLEYAPGTGWNYANKGYAIAGLIIQTVSGMPYEQYMARYVFRPLGMEHTTFGPPVDPAAPLAQGYGWTRGTLQPAPVMLARAQYASGAATYGSAQDVSAYLEALLAGGRSGETQVLRPESLDRMWQPAMQVAPDAAYALGWYVGTWNGRKAVFHDGMVAGSGSLFMLFPEDQMAVATVANLSSPAQEEMARGVAALLMGLEPPPATPPFYRAPSTFVPDRSVWQRYTGGYAVHGLGTMRLRQDGDRLVADVLSTQPVVTVELEAYGDNEFVTRHPLGLMEGLTLSFQQTGEDPTLLLVDGTPAGQKL